MNYEYKPEIRSYIRQNLIVFPLFLILYWSYLYIVELKSVLPLYMILVIYSSLIFYLGYQYLYTITISWKITEEQLIYTRGVIARKVDYIELYRINDFSEYSSIIDRLFSLKNIRIVSTDQSTPELIIKGINITEDVLTDLRKKIELRKEIRRIYEIANN